MSDEEDLLNCYLSISITLQLFSFMSFECFGLLYSPVR